MVQRFVINNFLITLDLTEDLLEYLEEYSLLIPWPMYPFFSTEQNILFHRKLVEHQQL